MGTKISKRKEESYRRAETVCRELRYQLSHAQNWDSEKLSGFLVKWMDKTGKIKFERPSDNLKS
jgi:hypothetical protein